MIRAFLFDLDGTLIDSERQTGEALARVLATGFGVEIEQQDRDFVVGRSWVAIYERMIARHPRVESWTRNELVARCSEAREAMFDDTGVPLLPAARETLAWTQAHPRALVTGSSRLEVVQVLPRIGPEAAFDVIFAAEDVPRSKPAPDGYELAMAALGVAPHECVVIEDSVAGIAAGRAAGCSVVAVRAGNFGGWDQSGAHLILDTLADLTPARVAGLAKRD
jgi:HAD superfamily hydrolase (TIGR01509 family)